MAATDTPPEITLLAGFVNTAELEKGIDELSTTAGAARWMEQAGFATAVVSESDRAMAVELREALRAILRGNHGAVVDRAAVDTFNRIAAAARPAVVLAGGSPRLAPTGTGASAALSAIVAAAARAAGEGTWDRLKICRDDTCRWAFYDRSRNRSGAWCAMQVCGSRAKMRAYRKRRVAPPA